MSYVCQCGEEFETLSRKRLHQSGDCPAQTDYIDADGKSADETAEETATALLTCTECDYVNEDAPFSRTDDYTSGQYAVEVTFECDECGFGNVNTAVMQ